MQALISRKLQLVIKADYKNSAKDMIVRACRNCDLLGLEETSAIFSFNEWFWEYEAGSY